MAIDVLTSNAPVEFHQHDYIPYRLLHNSTRSYDQSVMVTKPSLKRQMLALTDDSTIFFFFGGGVRLPSSILSILLNISIVRKSGALRFEPGTARCEVRMLPLCYAANSHQLPSYTYSTIK